MSQSEKPLSTRERILSTAQQLFHQRGFSEVGINMLCGKAGVVKGSFYHFFPSKQALLDAVIERNRHGVTEHLQVPAADGNSGRSQVLAQFTMILKAGAAQKQAQGRILGCTIGTLASELATCNESARAASAAAFRQWQTLLEDLVRLGIEDGSITQTVDPATTAICLLAVIQGMSTLGRSFNDADMLAEIAKTCVKRLLPVRIH